MKTFIFLVIITLFSFLQKTTKNVFLEKGKAVLCEKMRPDTAKPSFESRVLVSRPKLAITTTERFRVVIDICIDRTGAVVSAKYNQSASIVYDTSIIEKCTEIAKKYKFEERQTAPEKECGNVTFNLKPQ